LLAEVVLGVAQVGDVGTQPSDEPPIDVVLRCVKR
jgi:hypothetical protein